MKGKGAMLNVDLVETSVWCGMGGDVAQAQLKAFRLKGVHRQTKENDSPHLHRQELRLIGGKAISLRSFLNCERDPTWGGINELLTQGF